jgi:hypothetical protein
MEAFRPRLPGAAKRADEQGAALLQLAAFVNGPQNF